MAQETQSNFGRIPHRPGAQLMTWVTLACLLMITLPGLGRAEAPTGGASAPQANPAGQNAAIPAPSAWSDQSQTGTGSAMPVDCNRQMPPGKPAAVTSPVQPEAKPVKKIV